MSDLICELVKETDPFLREKPEAFYFENPKLILKNYRPN